MLGSYRCFQKVHTGGSCDGPEGLYNSQSVGERLVCAVRMPQLIQSDQWRNFESTLVNDVCAIYGIIKRPTIQHHHQWNVQAERFNRTHASTTYLPYYLMSGRDPKLSLDHLLAEPSAEGN